MIKYLVRRLGSWFLMIVVATNAIYFLTNAFLDPRVLYTQRNPPVPNSQIHSMLGQYNLDPATNIILRWWIWLKNIVLHWDWGKSPEGDSVNAQVSFRIWISGELMVGAFIIFTLIGIALAVYAASRQYRLSDRINQASSIITLNIPIVVAGLAIVLLAIKFNEAVGARVFYATGSSSEGVHGLAVIPDLLQHLLLPTLALVLTNYASIQMLQRSLLLDNIAADYVRTARAKGLTKTRAIRRHALRTSLIPVATQVAFMIPNLFTGAILTEKIFGWHGMGEYFIQTLSKENVHGVVATAAFGSLMTAIGAILADIGIVVLDPRVRVS